MPAILKIYSTKHAAPKQALKHSSTNGQLPQSNHNNMKNIVGISIKKRYNATSLHDCYVKNKFHCCGCECLDFTIRPHSPPNILLEFYFN
jgi:hypothetical protein